MLQAINDDEVKIYYLQTEANMTLAANMISQEFYNVIAIDVEADPLTNRADLLSISTNTQTFLFHLSLINYKILPDLAKILNSGNIIKAGVAIIGDISRLEQIGYKVNNSLEIQQLARICNLPIALDDLYHQLLPQAQRLKTVNHTNCRWDQPLTLALIDYAAKDAQSTLLVLQKLLNQKLSPFLDVINFNAHAVSKVNTSLGVDNIGINVNLTNSDGKHPEYYSFLTWIKSIIDQDNVSLLTLVNRASSSYSNFSKLSIQARTELAKNLLLLYAQNNELKYDSALQLFNPKSVVNNTIFTLSTTDIKSITNLKFKSACNYLFNSSSTFNSTVASKRHDIIAASIHAAIDNKQLTIINDKLQPT